MRPPIGGQAQAGVRLGAHSTPTTEAAATIPAMEGASITMAGVDITTAAGTTMAELLSHPSPVAAAATDTTRTSLASALTTMTEDTAVAG